MVFEQMEDIEIDFPLAPKVIGYFLGTSLCFLLHHHINSKHSIRYFFFERVGT